MLLKVRPGACSVAFILQSTAFTCQHLESRCEAFLQQYQTSLADMTEDSFKTQVRSCCLCVCVCMSVCLCVCVCLSVSVCGGHELLVLWDTNMQLPGGNQSLEELTQKVFSGESDLHF